MTTINLYQSQQATEKKNGSGSGNGGLFFSIGILVVTLLVLGGLKFAVSNLNQKNQTLEEDVKSESKSLAGLSELNRIVDLQTRLEKIKDNLQVEDGNAKITQMTEVLDHLGGDLGKGVVVSAYEYNAGNIKVTFSGNSFNEVSRQILDFKKSNYFKDVNMTDIKRSEKKIDCDVSMNLIK